MRRYFLLLLLALFAPFAARAARPVEQEWLNCTPSDRFAPLIELSIQSLPGYQERLVPYFTARGVQDNAAIESLAQEDLFHIAHALSILFEQDQTSVLHELLGEHFFLIEGSTVQIDHVGRELLGPLSFYLPLLDSVAPQLGLLHLRDLVFPSTQVVKTLQQYDPMLQGVTIGRVYFQSPQTGHISCLELFQAAPHDESAPQCIEATQERLSLLVNPASDSICPIDHLAIEMGTVEEIHQVHARIHELASDTLLPNQNNVSTNPGDGSTNTKALLRDSTETTFNKIVEFVHYEHLSH